MTDAVGLVRIERDHVVVQNNRVTKVEHWCRWNGDDWPVITVERLGDRFKGVISDPEHGGSAKRGTLDEVINGLHCKIQAQIRALFALENPNMEAIQKLDGFEKHLVLCC